MTGKKDGFSTKADDSAEQKGPFNLEWQEDKDFLTIRMKKGKQCLSKNEKPMLASSRGFMAVGGGKYSVNLNVMLKKVG